MTKAIVTVTLFPAFSQAQNVAFNAFFLKGLESVSFDGSLAKTLHRVMAARRGHTGSVTGDIPDLDRRCFSKEYNLQELQKDVRLGVLLTGH